MAGGLRGVGIANGLGFVVCNTFNMPKPYSNDSGRPGNSALKTLEHPVGALNIPKGPQKT